MAFYRGEEGSVKFKNGAGTVAAVASTRSWNFSLTKDVLETTAHGATTRAYVGSLLTVVVLLNCFTQQLLVMKHKSF